MAAGPTDEELAYARGRRDAEAQVRAAIEAEIAQALSRDTILAEANDRPPSSASQVHVPIERLQMIAAALAHDTPIADSGPEDVTAVDLRTGVGELLPLRREWATIITWVDPVKAGAKAPTTLLGPLDTTEQRDTLVETYLRDRDITRVQTVTRVAAYGGWVPDAEPIEVTDEVRNAALERLYQQMQPTTGHNQG